MAIRFIQEYFPSADVTWTRGPSFNGNPKGQLVVTETKSGRTIASVTQREVSEEYYGAGAKALKRALAEYKAAHQTL